MIWKRCSRCGARVPTGQQCKCKKERPEQKRTDGIRKEYHTERWKKAREYTLKKYGYVDLYALYHNGRVTPADRVHHIKLVLDDPEAFYDISNHFPCSDASHHEIHRRYKDEDMGQVQDELRSYLERYKKLSDELVI